MTPIHYQSERRDPQQWYSDEQRYTNVDCTGGRDWSRCVPVSFCTYMNDASAYCHPVYSSLIEMISYAVLVSNSTYYAPMMTTPIQEYGRQSTYICMHVHKRGNSPFLVLKMCLQQGWIYL